MPTAGSRFLIPAHPVRAFERALVVDGALFAAEGALAYRLDGTHWTRVPGVLLHESPRTFEVRGRELVRLPANGRYKLESYHPLPVLAEPGAAGRPLYVDERGAVFAWSIDRTATAHKDGPNGARGYFVQPLGPGWEHVTGTVPPNVIGIAVHGHETTLIGREGDVSIVRGQIAEPVIEIPRPRALAVVAAAPDRTVAVTSGSVRWAGQVAVRLDARTRAFLAAAGQTATRMPAIAVGPDEVIVGHGAHLARITPTGVALLDLPRGEVIALARDATHGFVALTHRGDVAVPRGTGLGELGALAALGGGPSHPIGAFTGPDGRARLVDFQRPLACATATGLEACGPAVDLRKRIVHPLADGLVIEDQSIATHLLTAAGSAKLEPPQAQRPVYAGSSGELFVLAGDRVHARRAGAWHPIATVGATAETLAITSAGAILVGMRGGAVLVSPAGGT